MCSFPEAKGGGRGKGEGDDVVRMQAMQAMQDG